MSFSHLISPPFLIDGLRVSIREKQETALLKKRGSETTSGQKVLYNPKIVFDLILGKIATKKVWASVYGYRSYPREIWKN
jgi:hypothetical protein